MSLISLQPSFEEVLDDVQKGAIDSDQFWVNFIATDELDNGTAKEELITVHKDKLKNDELTFESHNLKFEVESPHNYKIEYNDSNYEIRTPWSKSETKIKNSTSLDLSPEGSYFISGTDDGSLHIGETKTGKVNTTIKNAHESSVTKSQFFPSGTVALSTGLDLQIKIWDAITGENPRTFLGHKSRITDLALIERGRNFISSSFDGTIKLWDCASGTNISTFKRQGSLHDPVNTILVTEGDSIAGESSNANEFGTAGKHIYAGHRSGVITLFDIVSREQIGSIDSMFSPVTKVINFGENFILTAYENGTLASWDKRNLAIPVIRHELHHSIKDLISTKGKTVTVLADLNLLEQLDLEQSSSTLFYSGLKEEDHLIASARDGFFIIDVSGTLYKA